LLDHEFSKFGSINITQFFVRRALRIYPLMAAFTTAMFFLSTKDGHAVARYLGVLVLVDNLCAWKDGYNAVVPYTGHLWTLSYEFQIYLLIPLAFVTYKAMGRDRFLLLLCFVLFFSFVARAVFLLLGAPYLVAWITPFLRPDSTIAGIVIALGFGRRLPTVVVGIILTTAVLLLVTHPNILEARAWSLALYPVCAMIAGCLVLLSIDERSVVRRTLSRPVLVFLGTISFGLYVFHVMAIHLTAWLIVFFNIRIEAPGWYYILVFASALGITIGFATLSWFGYERWFLRLKGHQVRLTAGNEESNHDHSAPRSNIAKVGGGIG
jgi:peptidoglycan/LPS O-acetylase OafA/YrhL